ncbi:juvenile hormone epoxide hydrolase-like [Watersipora subatra]|uniref:juvenile hormone epoxide hydrolase-like n=1 Tax=Watersipora subatra TaxID=2589382 RepID=UPI00355C1858
MAIIKYALLSVSVVVLAWLVRRQLTPHELLSAPEWRNFGKLTDVEALEAENLSPENFEIAVNDAEVSDYKNRLVQARLPPALSEEANMTYGYPSAGLSQLRDHMLKFNLTQWAKLMNSYEHYKLTLYGLKIHYIKVSGNPDLRRVPLLLIHGWPGSFYEFYKAIPLLQQKAELHGFSYDLIIPSLPGYGFSEAAYRTGLNPEYAAAIFNKLMNKLGYDKYIPQGGDWGAFVTEWIVTLYPERVIGFHTNMFSLPAFDEDLRTLPYTLAAAIAPGQLMQGSELALSEAKGLFSGYTFLFKEGGYFHLQATKPDTVGAALTDSPLGLAVYILEKFYTWTDSSNVDKPLQEATESLPFSIDDALNNVLVYWHSNSIQSSVRFYKEAFSNFERRPFPRTDVAGAVLMTKYEIAFCPRFIAELRIPNLVQYTALMKGGHFAAFEIPEEFSSDVVRFTHALLN